MLRFFVVR
jgi:hypothetical protein